MNLMYQHFLSLHQILILILFLEPGANLRTGALGLDQTQAGVKPVSAGTTLLGGQDLHLLAGLQFVVKRNKLVIDLGTPAAIANVGMDMIGKVDRGGTSRQVDDIAVRCEDVDAILENIGLHTVNKFLGIIDVAAPFHHTTEPVDAFIVFVARATFLITPMGGDTKLGIFIHFDGTDLHFHRAAIVIYDRSVERLVEIILGGGDVIIEFIGNGPPMGVNNAQSGITGRNIGNYEPDSAHVPHQVEGFAFLHHLFIDGI